MNIYLKMEIKARELEGRLLLGMVAAERGHTVLLGEMRPIVRETDAAPPGVYHDTCLYPSRGQTRLRRQLRERGWTVTSQDEEHGLLEPTYDNYAVKRYSEENIELAARVYTWGPHDTAALEEVYPDHRAKLVPVGSPRIDLDRDAFASFFRSRPKPGLQDGRPYLLFANNFTRVIGVNRIDTFVRHMRGAGYFDGDDDDFEFLQYEEASAQMDFLPHMIRAIRQVARRHPDLTVVVRPHPQETEGAWQDLLGDIPNVLVSGYGDIGRWLRGSVAVVQSGDTTAFEATVAGVPLIAFTPVRGAHHWAARFANRLGFAANDVEELLQVVAALRDGSAEHSGVLRRDRALLAERILVDEDRLAADAIVDGWDEVHDGPSTDMDEIVRATRRSRAQWRAKEFARPAVHQAKDAGTRLRAGASASRARYLTAQKFPPIEQAELDELVEGYRGALGRFDHVRAHLIGPRLIGVDSA